MSLSETGIPAVAEPEPSGDRNRLLQGPLLPAIIRLAAPVVGLEALYTAYHLVDLVWVGRLGAAASAALTTSFFAIWILSALAEGVGTGILAQVARALGAGDRPRAEAAAAQGILVAFGFGLLFAGGVRLLVPPLFRWLAVPPDVAPLGVAYLGTIFTGAPALFLTVAAESIWRSAGDTVTPFKVIGASLLVNAFVNPLLIFGIGPFPELGVAGAAWATVFSWIGAVAVFTFLAGRAGSRFPLDRRALLQPDVRVMQRTIEIGLPRFLVGSLFSAVYLALSSLVSRFGTAALAVLGLANRIESVVYLACSATGAATATLVGQNLGAGQPQRAGRAANTAAWLAMGLAFLPMIGMLAVPSILLRPFTADPEVLALAGPYLRIIGISQLFMALEIIFASAFAGAGDTLPPMLVELPIAISRVPLAWWAAFRAGLGVIGVAWVITITCIIRGLWLALWFRTGRWQHRRI